MAKTFNNAQLLGRLGRDPVLRKTKNGISVANFPVATDRRVRAGAEPVTDWIDVVCWGKQAEAVAEYVQQGDLLFLNGRIQQNRYEDANGNMQYRIEVHAQEVSFLPSRNFSGMPEEQVDLPDEEIPGEDSPIEDPS